MHSTSSASTSRSRAPALNENRIESIVRLLDQWEGELTWVLLAKRIEKELGSHYTRQALDRHARIKLAYQTTKKRGCALPKPPTISKAELTHRVNDYESLSRENERLKTENTALLQQFVVWLFNAGQNGVTREMLNKPLPLPNRGASVPPFAQHSHENRT